MENTQNSPANKRKSNTSLIIVIVIIIAAAIVGGVLYSKRSDAPGKPSTSNNAEYAVAAITNAFGANLKMVSLVAPAADVAAAMDSYYKPFVTPALLATWKSDPSIAPGKKTSSPYPDKIEIASVSKLTDKTYRVVGNVMEVTNSTTGTKPASNYPMILSFENIDGVWLITNVQLGPQR
jgi:hypothetical protein